MGDKKTTRINGDIIMKELFIQTIVAIIIGSILGIILRGLGYFKPWNELKKSEKIHYKKGLLLLLASLLINGLGLTFGYAEYTFIFAVLLLILGLYYIIKLHFKVDRNV